MDLQFANDKHIVDGFLQLRKYCESENFVGWDPYDGLNSKVFQATPLKNWDLARFAWIQFFKRNPINLRSIMQVPREANPKGIALSLNAYCNMYHIQKMGFAGLQADESEILKRISQLADNLLEIQSEGYSGACWGYNFDWQGRRVFFFPKYTPTVVATAFCSSALLEAWKITKIQKYLDTALSSADFVLKDLGRTPAAKGFLFSYSPLDGNNTVYNASLMGVKILSYCYQHTGSEIYRTTAQEAVSACAEAQEIDGSWVYGQRNSQQWKDSFHTGYVLEALKVYRDCTGDENIDGVIEKGLDYYLDNFFMETGLPKYYHNKAYPVDIHCPGQLFVTLSVLKRFPDNQQLARKVAHWAFENMQDSAGYFYYQIKQGISSKISYMRWSNAFMLYSLSFLLKDIANLPQSQP